MEENPVLQIALSDIRNLTVPVSDKEIQVQISQQKSKDEYFIIVKVNGIVFLKEKVEPKRKTNAVGTIVSPDDVTNVNVINANEVSNEICKNGSFLENMWLVDGTGKYYENNYLTLK